MYFIIKVYIIRYIIEVDIIMYFIIKMDIIMYFIRQVCLRPPG